MSCPAPGTNVNKVVEFESYPMAWTVAQAQASQAVHKHKLSVNNIYDYHIDEYPDPVCTKHACLAQLLKYAQQKVVPALLCCLILIASPPCMLVLSASAMMPAWSIRAETSHGVHKLFITARM